MGPTNEQILEFEIGYTIKQASEKLHQVIICKTEQERQLYIDILERRFPNLKFGDQMKPHVVVGQGNIKNNYCVHSDAYKFMDGDV